MSARRAKVLPIDSAPRHKGRRRDLESELAYIDEERERVVEDFEGAKSRAGEQLRRSG